MIINPPKWLGKAYETHLLYCTYIPLAWIVYLLCIYSRPYACDAVYNVHCTVHATQAGFLNTKNNMYYNVEEVLV